MDTGQLGLHGPPAVQIASTIDVVFAIVQLPRMVVSTVRVVTWTRQTVLEECAKVSGSDC